MQKLLVKPKGTSSPQSTLLFLFYIIHQFMYYVFRWCALEFQQFLTVFTCDRKIFLFRLHDGIYQAYTKLLNFCAEKFHQKFFFQIPVVLNCSWTNVKSSKCCKCQARKRPTCQCKSRPLNNLTKEVSPRNISEHTTYWKRRVAKNIGIYLAFEAETIFHILHLM